VTEHLDPLQTLIEGIRREDGALRRLVAAFPREIRDQRSEPEELSAKDTLGHLAYWDDFTVHFFLSKIDPASYRVPPPSDFEAASRRAMVTMADLPYGEVLARYLEATGAMIEFLEEHWENLSERERDDFQIPLKHRRQHRLKLSERWQQIDWQGLEEPPQKMSEPA